MKAQRRVSNALVFASSLGVFLAGALAPSQAAPVQKPIVFSKDIMPILSDKCFKCHGPDSASRMANMRLDQPESVFAKRPDGYVIVPKQPEKSLLIQRITSKDDPMPPADSGKSLSPDQKATLLRWIREGARYGKLWSFEPLPATVPVPKVVSDWPRDDLDRLVLQNLKQNGLTPSKPASRDRWLRRVTLDLTGLPPTEAEMTAFENDRRPDAFERVADRLLASPHFGERLAVDWLDAARYADSYGYQSDLLMPTWPYRDWVVKAFNENMPYDRFLTDQLAGDLLPNPTRDERLATAFNRLHRQSNEGGSIALEFKTAYAEDRVETFGTAVLGLTVGCARCHDHKFDPITQKEYYQLFGYFNNIDEYGLLLSTEIVPTPSLLLPTPEQEAKLKVLQDQSNSCLKSLSSSETSASSRFEQWIAAKPTKPEIPGLLARFPLDSLDSGKFVDAVGGPATGEKIGDPPLVEGRQGKALLFDGDNGVVFKGLPARERYEPFTWSFWIEDPGTSKGPIILLHRTGGTDVGFCGFDLRLEQGYLTARVMRHWPGNAVAVRTTTAIPKNRWSHVAWSWDGTGHASGLKLYLDGRPAAITVLQDKLWKKIDAYGDLGPSGHEWSFAQRFRDAGFKDGKLDDVAFANRALSPLEVAQLCDGHSLSDALQEPAQHKDALLAYYISAFDEPCRTALGQVQKAQKELTEYEEPIQEISVMEKAKKPVPAYLLARGMYDAPRNESTLVFRNVPKSLPPITSGGRNDRLTLAQWATEPNHPLTSRVAVNRLWQLLFGVGLVETTENFGVQGGQPSNPELLDYLARFFVSSGWNVKDLLRKIVLSSTYRQDSALTPALRAKDPGNRLLARGPSNRLSAEMIRDTVLAGAGLLNGKIGGPPVNPYQPGNIWQENNTMSPPFVQSTGPDLYRRSLYTTWKRTTPMPSMMMFDANSREACVVRRPATNTPLQALVLLNDIQYVEAARVLADFVLRTLPTDEQRIKTAFVRLAGRRPDSRELSILAKTLQEQRKIFSASPNDARKLVAIGESKPSASLRPEDLAAMTVTVQTILNSDAVIWKR